jgi:hypothetical protein
VSSSARVSEGVLALSGIATGKDVLGRRIEGKYPYRIISLVLSANNDIGGGPLGHPKIFINLVSSTSHMTRACD